MLLGIFVFELQNYSVSFKYNEKNSVPVFKKHPAMKTYLAVTIREQGILTSSLDEMKSQ